MKLKKTLTKTINAVKNLLGDYEKYHEENKGDFVRLKQDGYGVYWALYGYLYVEEKIAKNLKEMQLVSEEEVKAKQERKDKLRVLISKAGDKIRKDKKLNA